MEIVLILIIIGLVSYIVISKNKNPKEKEKISKEEKQKIAEQKKAFDSLMKYDYSVAIRKSDS